MVQHQAALDGWRAFSAFCRAINVRPQAIRVYREAWERALGAEMQSGGGEGVWQQRALERYTRHTAAGVTYGLGGSGGFPVYRIVFAAYEAGDGLPGLGGDYHRVWLRADGTLDESHSYPPNAPRQFNANDCPVARWRCMEITVRSYLGGGSAYVGDADNTADLYVSPALSWYCEEILWPVANACRAAGPLGTIWNASIDALERNLSTLHAMGMPHSTEADVARLVGLSDALIEATKNDARDTALQMLGTGGALAAPITTAVDAARGAKARAAGDNTLTSVLQAVTVVEGILARAFMEIGGMAIARINDVFGRTEPVYEELAIAETPTMPAAPPGYVEPSQIRYHADGSAYTICGAVGTYRPQPNPKGGFTLGTAAAVALVAGAAAVAWAWLKRRR
jgi:hypothetical protein